MKKIVLITGIVIIIGVALFLVYGRQSQQGTTDSRVGFSITNFFPFGKSPTDTQSATTSVSTTEQSTSTQPVSVNTLIPRLRKISNEPVAGSVIFNIGSTSIVRFVEKGTGNVYQVRSDANGAERLTNTTLPKIVRAYWLPDGSGFLAQTLTPDTEVIQTTFIQLKKTATTSSTEILTPYKTVQSNLPTGIKELTIKPDGSKIFYYVISGLSSKWFISKPDGTGSIQIFSHPLTEWRPTWISPNIISIQTKSSFEETGFSYIFDVSTGVLKKIGLPAKGISSILRPDTLWSLTSNGGVVPQLFLIDNKKVVSIKTNVNTLAEKCVWTKEKSPSVYCAAPHSLTGGSFPDSWYQGLIQTEDALIHIDLLNNIYTVTSDVTNESKEKIDVIDLMSAPNDSHLIFRNKIDGYLWMLRVN